MTMQEYLEKYGTRTLMALMGEYIRRAPEFKGQTELSIELGTHMGDLVSALEDFARKGGKMEGRMAYGTEGREFEP